MFCIDAIKNPNQVERLLFFIFFFSRLGNNLSLNVPPVKHQRENRSHIPSLGVSADLETGVILPGGVRS